MRSMVEGAGLDSVFVAAPSTAYRRSPSPAARERIPDCYSSTDPGFSCAITCSSARM